MERGSVFIETLVAAAVVAMAVGVMMQSVSHGFRSEKHIDERRLALLVAQSRLDTVDGLGASAVGNSSGTDAGFNWRLSVSRTGGDNGGGILNIAVVVGDATTPNIVSLNTMRAVPGNAPVEPKPDPDQSTSATEQD
jgi:type II secretion system protein I